MIKDPKPGDLAVDSSDVSYICYESSHNISVWFKSGYGFANPIFWSGHVEYTWITRIDPFTQAGYYEFVGAEGLVSKFLQDHEVRVESLWTADW